MCPMVLTGPVFFLAQNPPAIPALPIAALASLLRGFQLVVDWHNYGRGATGAVQLWHVVTAAPWLHPREPPHT